MICFQCRWIYTFKDGKRTAKDVIAESPRSVFNRILRKAGIPLAK
ncbi:MAG: hypothetical protein VX951_02075 [Planctomycetota bacterium]|nr:hypothetical protein [Planctomycetota bacterium]